MTISYVKDKFIANATYEENHILRSAGFKADQELQKWVTTNHQYVEKLIQYCDHSAVAAIRNHKQNIQNSIAASAKSESTIKIYHPDAFKPFPYQVAGVEYILARPGTLLADQMGLGKSAQALLTMNMLRDVECLLICPSILKYNWLKEARKTLIGTIKAFIYESKKLRVYEKKLTDHNKTTILHIINYDILEKHMERLLLLPFNMFIADECHYAKNPAAKRTRAVQQLAKKAKKIILITGTPIFNKPKDLFIPLNILDPNAYPNFQHFKKLYSTASKTKIEELNHSLRAKYMIRRMTKDVLKDLPDKIKDVIVLQEDDLADIVAKEQRALIESKDYQEKLKAEVENLREMAKSNASFEGVYKDKVKTLRGAMIKNFTELSKIRKELAIKKIPYALDFIKEILSSSEDDKSKVVVFGHHTEVLETLYRGLKEYNPVLITGAVNDSNRQKAIELFSNKNNCRVFVGSMGAAGTGVDGLQNNCNTVVFIELDWTPSMVDQAESRLQRIGQKNTVWVYHIVADGSIDSKIAKMLVEKEMESRRILDYKPEELYAHLINTAK